MKIIVAKRLFPLLALCMLILSSVSSCGNSSASTPTSWAWLGAGGGTYWYVPTPYLPAVKWDTSDPSAYIPIMDQTVWHIESYENGYFFGPVVAKLTAYPVTCQYAIGSVTPEGNVYISFNSLSNSPLGNPSVITGTGKMVQQGGAWTFNMQMASGSSSSMVTHWAYMYQCSPNQSCWNDLPGIAQSIPDLLAQCE